MKGSVVMIKIKTILWKKLLTVGDLLSTFGNDIIIKASDRLNDFDKAKWLKNHNFD